MEETFIFPGGGNLYASYNGQGNNTVSFTADPNEGEEDRELMLTFRTYSNSMSTQRKVIQRGAEIGEYVLNIYSQPNGSNGVWLKLEFQDEDENTYNIPYNIQHDNGVIETVYSESTFSYGTNTTNGIHNFSISKYNGNKYIVWLNTNPESYREVTNLTVYCNFPKISLAGLGNSISGGNFKHASFEFDNVQITNLYETFYYLNLCNNTTGFETFETSLVKNMSHTFYNCANSTFNWEPIEQWNFSNVTNGCECFYNTRIKNITSGFQNLVDGSRMFLRCSNLDTVKLGDLNYLTNAREMFNLCNHINTISLGNCNSLEDVTEMFNGVNVSNSIILGDISIASGAGQMFNNGTIQNSVIIGNILKTTSISHMFNNATISNDVKIGNMPDLISINNTFSFCAISNSLTLGYMPALESAVETFFNLNCPTIIMGSAGVDSSNMFYRCNYTYNVTIKDTSRLENASHMFNGCHNIVNLDSSNWTLSNLTNAANMFANCINLQDFNTSHWNLANLVDGSYMFYNCDGLTHFEAGDLEHMTNGYEGFSMCDGLNTVTIGNLPSLTNAVNMFCNSEFHHLTIGNMPAVTNIAQMFNACVNAESINIGSLTSVINSQYAFQNCSNLSGLTLGNFDSLNNASYMFSGCFNLTGNIYITTNNLYNAGYMFRNAGRNSTGFNVYAYEGTETWNKLSASNAYLNYGNLIPITD